MLTIAFVLVVAAASLVFVILCNTHRVGDRSVRTPQAVLSGITMIMLLIASKIITECNDKSVDQPSALDVYNGKTTLAITYIDSIPVDTTIVFKK